MLVSQPDLDLHSPSPRKTLNSTASSCPSPSLAPQVVVFPQACIPKTDAKHCPGMGIIHELTL